MSLVSNDGLRAAILTLRDAGVSTYSIPARYGIPEHAVSGVLYRHKRIHSRTYRVAARRLGLS